MSEEDKSLVQDLEEEDEEDEGEIDDTHGQLVSESIQNQSESIG